MPDSQTQSVPPVRPRRLWLAALLSLCGAPVGHVYCGRPKRALVFGILGLLVAPITAFCLITFPMERLSVVVLLCLALAFPFVQATDAILIARRTKLNQLKRYQRWWVYVAILLLSYPINNVTAVSIKTYIAEAFSTPTRGMSPTIMPGDRFLVNKLWMNPNAIKRNSIATFRSVEDESVIYVMRVIAVGGDELYMKDTKVYVNGQEVDIPESHIDGETPRFIDTENLKSQIIPQDTFFVLGDHRNMSADSRYFGPVPNKNYYGDAVMIFWSSPHVFPDPRDRSRYEVGPIAWSRIGKSLR